MIIGINPELAPLRKYASPHLKQIKYQELSANLAARGVEIVDIGESAIKVSLRGLLQANGTIQRGQAALVEVLQLPGSGLVQPGAGGPGVHRRTRHLHARSSARPGIWRATTGSPAAGHSRERRRRR